MSVYFLVKYVYCVVNTVLESGFVRRSVLDTSTGERIVAQDTVCTYLEREWSIVGAWSFRITSIFN